MLVKYVSLYFKWQYFYYMFYFFYLFIIFGLICGWTFFIKHRNGFFLGLSRTDTTRTFPVFTSRGSPCIISGNWVHTPTLRNLAAWVASSDKRIQSSWFEPETTRGKWFEINNEEIEQNTMNNIIITIIIIILTNYFNHIRKSIRNTLYMYPYSSLGKIISYKVCTEKLVIYLLPLNYFEGIKMY